MKKKLNCIMLIDDDFATNLYHKIIIEEFGCAEQLITMNSAEDALEYMMQPYDEDHIRPSLIFLDINMPRMTGWEFLEEYKKLSASQQAENVIVMLSTSSSPDDIQKAADNPYIREYRCKPLSEGLLAEVIGTYWPTHLGM